MFMFICMYVYIYIYICILLCQVNTLELTNFKDLKELCRKDALTISGAKHVLVSRLVEHMCKPPTASSDSVALSTIQDEAKASTSMTPSDVKDVTSMFTTIAEPKHVFPADVVDESKAQLRTGAYLVGGLRDAHDAAGADVVGVMLGSEGHTDKKRTGWASFAKALQSIFVYFAIAYIYTAYILFRTHTVCSATKPLHH